MDALSPELVMLHSLDLSAAGGRSIDQVMEPLAAGFDLQQAKPLLALLAIEQRLIVRRRTSADPAPRHVLRLGQRLAELDQRGFAELVEEAFEIGEIAEQVARAPVRIACRRALVRRDPRVLPNVFIGEFGRHRQSLREN